ncbi:MAG: GspE/PulE family protein [Pirellulaceae bacterium]|nr:GspE/PulE family protein [Pirellulaceae bacterium]
MSTQEVPDFRAVDLAELPPQEVCASIIREAVALRASDLFLLSEENSLKIGVRNMGRFEQLAMVSREQGRHLLNYFKSVAAMDIAERRRPQEGRWIFESEHGAVDLRINIIPTIFGEDLTARLLDRRMGLRALDAIGVTKDDYHKLTAMLASPSGLLLVTGPTGTGKTTTLYASLQYLNTGTRKIHTIEDPIEYALPGIRQSQVHAKLGIDFPELLRNILRQAPDVIMIGEIRDEETAHTAVRAANSGHLVLATLHSPVAAGAIQSIRALGANPYFLSSGLLGVIAQRLVRMLCPNCRVAYDISESPETFAEIQSLLEPGLGTYIYGPGGCEQCRHQGYLGRIGVFEIMTFNRQLRKLVLDARPAEDLQAAAIAAGMVEFRRAAMLKVAQGITSMEEVLRELPAEYLGLEV